MKAKNAVIGGTRVMISIANLDPIRVYDLKRKRSPNTNPTSPDRISQNQFPESASAGNIIPRYTRVKMLRKTKPIISLRMLTATDPILLLADSNDNEVIVQKHAVSSAANSPE
jgi:hypothetical protein